MRYLIHNVYGDCDHLIAECPADVECVPRGWTPEEEASLSERLQAAELSGISCLPCLLEWVPDISAWVETRVADLQKPWTWIAIDTAHMSNVDDARKRHNSPPPMP
jgi:hypothetical protein